MAGSLARLHGLENEIWTIRNRGFSIFESPTMGGPEGHFFLKGQHVPPQEVRTFARQLEARAKAGFNAPAPCRPPPPAAEIFKSAPLTIQQKAEPMTDIFRGSTEADVRSDMALLAEEHGSQAAAAKACGIDKNRWNNFRNGIVRVGADIMDGLYGPRGTDLRKAVRGKPAAATIPAGDAAEAAGDPPPPVTVSAEAPKAAPEIEDQAKDCPPAAPEAGTAGGEGAPLTDAPASVPGSDLDATPPADRIEITLRPIDFGDLRERFKTVHDDDLAIAPAGAKPAASQLEPPDRLAAVFEAAQAEIANQLKMIDGELEALEDERRALEADADKLRKASAALAELVK